MARITIEADSPDQLLVFVRRWLAEQPGSVAASSCSDADKIRAAIEKSYGPVALRFVRDVCLARKRGETVTINRAFAESYGVNDARRLGGAIGSVATGLYKATGRWVVDRISRHPSVWTVSDEDADVILAALDARTRLSA